MESWSHPFQFLPVGCVAAVLSCVFFSPIEALPYVLWFVFLGMLLDLSVSKKSLASWFAPLFNHPFVLYLGKISYSIYLSHTLVMIICHSFILNLLDELSQAYQAGALAFLTVNATIFISHFLYKYIEHPGMSFGRRFIKWINCVHWKNVRSLQRYYRNLRYVSQSSKEAYYEPYYLP